MGSSPKYRVLLSVCFGPNLLGPCKMKELFIYFVMIVLSASSCSMPLCWCPGLGQSNKARKKVAKGWEGLCLCGMRCWSAQDILVSGSEAVALEQGLLQTISSRQIDCVCSCWLCSCLLCVQKGRIYPLQMQGLHTIFLELSQSAKSAGAFWK